MAVFLYGEIKYGFAVRLWNIKIGVCPL